MRFSVEVLVRVRVKVTMRVKIRVKVDLVFSTIHHSQVKERFRDGREQAHTAWPGLLAHPIRP